MYAFGGDQDPAPDSINVLEDILVDYINEMASINEDFKFVLRKDPKKLARVEELIAMNREIAKARDVFREKADEESEGSEDEDEEDEEEDSAEAQQQLAGASGNKGGYDRGQPSVITDNTGAGFKV
ncbi:hypothetical protein EV182_005587 [Spiromyces aspiralis]|uniref:Uncharacterized protein n=1 Tax=Spiromyces aspiralis TaxID=68401 RepID=A0ACC1HME6_9FUNG|nr:hypothetical protein EV182_005587 [Spiromyces aspiralis]